MFAQHHVRRLPLVLLLAVCLLSLAPAALAAPSPQESQPEVAHRHYFPLIQAPMFQRRDDAELVFINDNGRIFAVDPHVPAGSAPVSYQSPTLFWRGLVLGDFNGDGDQEILAMKDGHAEVLDPVVPPGRLPATGDWNIGAPSIWYNLDTGDIDRDGRDEIVLLRTEDAGAIRSRLLVYDGNPSGRVWTKVQDLGHATLWDDLAMGDVNGDGREDIGLIRSEDRRLLILNPVDWSWLHNTGYGFPWIDLELIDTHRGVGGSRVEIVLSRREVLATLPSLLVFRWSGGTTLTDVWQGFFYPYFTEVEGCDLNGDGDEEIVMYRDESGLAVTLSSRNIAGPAMRTFEPRGASNPGAGWLNLKCADLDQDRRDEVVLVRPTTYRVYDQPEASDHFYEASGSFSASFAAGNLDG